MKVNEFKSKFEETLAYTSVASWIAGRRKSYALKGKDATKFNFSNYLYSLIKYLDFTQCTPDALLADYAKHEREQAEWQVKHEKEEAERWAQMQKERENSLTPKTKAEIDKANKAQKAHMRKKERTKKATKPLE